MEGIRGKHSYTLDAAMLAERLAEYSEVLIDIGAGDGRYVRHAARSSPARLAIGVDTCRENLRVASRDAPRNALYIIADGRALPAELHGTATRVVINFPWGSLLGGLLDGDAGLLAGLAAISRPGAALELRLNAGAAAEAGWALEAGAQRIRDVLCAGGFAVGRAAALDLCALRAFPSSWARRLAFGRDPRALYLPARAPPLLPSCLKTTKTQRHAGHLASNIAPRVTITDSMSVFQAGAAVTANIGRVSDAQDAAGSLALGASGAPAGMTASLKNIGGLVFATVSAGCTVAPGTYSLSLTVTDSGALTATKAFKVEVL